MAQTLNPDIIGLLVGTIITLMIASYLFGDNALYRWALAILVGCGTGYAVGVALHYLTDWVVGGLGSANPWTQIYHLVPLILGILLLLKGFSPTRFLGRVAVIGNISLGFLIGVGAAVAVAGALFGTLIPQMTAAGASLTLTSVPGILEGILMLVGTITSLLIFSPRAQETQGKTSTIRRWVQGFGRGFITFALSIAFAGLITSALTVLLARLSSLVQLLQEQSILEFLSRFGG